MNESAGMSVRRDPAVLVTELEDELVLLHPTSRAMFTLSATGQVVWKALDGGVDAAIDAVTTAFDVDREVATADVYELIGALAAAGLVHRG